jgi:hypothetical protein
MSGDVARSIGTLAGDTAVEAAWAQWGVLTAAAVPVERRRVWTIVDPEALVLLSLAARSRERRLDDLLAGWARAGSALLSVQRLRTVAKTFPTPVREQVGDFARYAAEAGDPRWRSHAARVGERSGPEPRRKDPGPLRVVEGPALMLRLRAGFGVGAKADLLAFLLGLGGASAGLKAITVATGYSDRAMRTAAEEMALARFIHEVQGPPSAYRADPAAWARVLEIHRLAARAEPEPSIPPWSFWSVAFAFLAAVVEWAGAAEREAWSDYVASSRARDLVESHRRRLGYLHLDLAADDVRGAAYLDTFHDLVERVAAWTEGRLYTGDSGGALG